MLYTVWETYSASFPLFNLGLGHPRPRRKIKGGLFPSRPFGYLF